MSSISPIDSAHRVIDQLQTHTGAALFGLESSIEALLISLMAKGHILLEDVPGVGKTALAKAFSEALGLSFRRIQCTPDLLPADIVGGLIFHPKTGEFTLRKGPIFTNILLVDEINRALPRTQSALLEAMAEGQVTIDGETHPLPQPFLVIATQNPLESQGVFPLPEAQLDRFLIKTSLGYPSADDDVEILSAHLAQPDEVQQLPHTGPVETQTQINDANSSDGQTTMVGELHTVSTLEDAVSTVQISRDVLVYISNVVRATRNHPDVAVGASPRAMIMLAKAAQAAALLKGRSFVTPDDVQRMAEPVLFHRLILFGSTEDSDLTPTDWMKHLLETVEVPIERGLR